MSEANNKIHTIERQDVPRGSIAVYVSKPQNRITRYVYFHPLHGHTYVAREGFFRVVPDPCQKQTP
jgi:hypothetical protein